MRRILGASPIEDWHVTTAGDGDCQRFVYTFRRVIEVNTFPQFSRIHSDDVVLAAVVMWRSAEYLRSNFLLMYLCRRILDPLPANVQQKVAESRRAPKVAALGNALHQRKLLFIRRRTAYSLLGRDFDIQSRRLFQGRAAV